MEKDELKPLVGGTEAAAPAPMTKAYDFAHLAQRAKAKGLNVAEDGAKALVVTVAEWLKDSAKLSDTKLDDVAVGAFLDTAVEAALAAADKIDGEVG